jgi:hypothetical protein
MGTYAESLLTPDEKVLRRERQHPIALILDSWLAIIFWGATAILLVVKVLLPRDIFGWDLFGEGTWFNEVGTIVIWLTLLGGVIVVGVRWWLWRTQEFLVTNRRLVLAGASTRSPLTARSRRSTTPSSTSASLAGCSTTAT